jgi:hypothetical protein
MAKLVGPALARPEHVCGKGGQTADEEEGGQEGRQEEGGEEGEEGEEEVGRVQAAALQRLAAQSRTQTKGGDKRMAKKKATKKKKK